MPTRTIQNKPGMPGPVSPLAAPVEGASDGSDETESPALEPGPEARYREFRGIVDGTRIAQSADPREPIFEEIRGIFGDETLYSDWRAWIDGLSDVTPERLADYRDALREIREAVETRGEGVDGDEGNFRTLLTRSFGDDPDNIIAREWDCEEQRCLGSGADELYQGFVLADVSVDRLRRAIWNHGNEYGEGQIGAPYVACSQIVRRDSATHILQQIVLDIPWPAGNDMTLNDTHLRQWGGLGWMVGWDLVDPASTTSEDRQWRCLDDENDEVTLESNAGYWRLLPIGPSSTLIWYGTQSEVSGLDPTSGQATDALKENIQAFVRAARGRFGE